MIDRSSLQRENRSTVGSSALAARRWFLVLAPVLAGMLAIGGAIADPAMDLEGEAMYAVYAADPDQLRWKSVLYHFSYALLGMAALMLAATVRQRGNWPANVAGVLGLFGISSVPGFWARSGRAQRVGAGCLRGRPAGLRPAGVVPLPGRPPRRDGAGAPLGTQGSWLTCPT